MASRWAHPVEVEITDPAKKGLLQLDRAAQKKVLKGIHKFAQCGHGDTKRLKGRQSTRLRIGKYRAIDRVLGDR